MARLVSNSLVAIFTLLFAAVATAQGVQTGSIRGVVKDATGLVVPQATIHAESPAQLGLRDTASDAAGAYQFQGLAPGLYTLTFEFTGFQTVTSTVQVSVGAIARLDVTLPMPTVTEAVTVTAAKPSVLTARGGGSTMRTADLERLPTGRTPSLVAELAPGLTTTRLTSIRSPSPAPSATTTCSCSTAWILATTCLRAPMICSSRKRSKKRRS
jgi:hypothetical protein